MLVMDRPESADRLAQWRRGLTPKLSQQKLAEKLGLKRTTYASYEERIPIPGEIQDRLKALGFDAEEGLTPLRGRLRGKLKVYGSIGAGDTPQTESDFEVLDVPAEFDQPDFGGLTCEGDSMMPYIHPGDSLVFRNESRPRRGMVFAIRKVGESYPCVKEIGYLNGDWWLVPWNPKHEKALLGNAAVLGVLVGIISKDETLKMGPVPDGMDQEYIVRKLMNRLP